MTPFLLVLALTAANARVVLLPFDNFAGVDTARGAVTLLVSEELEKKGYEVVRGEPVEKVLETGRVRYLESLTADARNQVLGSLDASAVVTGALYTWAPGPHGVASLSVRVVRADGTTAFWNVAAVSVDETEGLLGLGRVTNEEELARAAISRVLQELPAPGASVKPVSLLGRPRRLPAPRTFRSAALQDKTAYRICLLPVENPTSAREASRNVSDVLLRRLDQSGAFEIVEPADLRAAMVAEKVRGFTDMNPSTLMKLSARVKTTLFLRASVITFHQGSLTGSSQRPEIALELQLVDAQANRILWTSQHARKGSDYEFLFQRGAITDVVALADRLVSEMVDAFLRTRPTDLRSAAASPPKGEAAP